MKNVFMKKVLVMCLLILLLFMVISCTDKGLITDEQVGELINDLTDIELKDDLYQESNYDDKRVEVKELYDDQADYDPASMVIKLRKDSLDNIKQPTVSNDLFDLGIETLSFLFDKSTEEEPDTGVWYNARLKKDIDSKDIIEAVNTLDVVELVELNYVYQSEAIDYPTVLENPRVQEQWHLENAGVQDAWYWLESQGYEAGGSSNVVIAVIDTGVDYNHVDLAANMWVNTGEIPNNGIDDDGNGFIDDIHGVNVVSDERFHSGDPMDNHGHGTHVAGIAAATNNKEGIVGVAYNSKIMAIKAGNASGYFLQTDIAEAILYAYEQGADVINMSFGGTTVSNLVQDALSVAYTRSVLVAAAGNSGAKNQGLLGIPNYPAAYPYVVGVMSINQSNIRSLFSNYDSVHFNNIEYEMYAPGEGIISALPGDKYASWSGTSMAAPIVAGTAALMRSYYTDRDLYPNKFIMGQLAGTVDMDVVKFILPDGSFMIDPYMGRLNLLSALTTDPKPAVNFYDFYGFDSIDLDSSNNGDYIIDAGELIDLGITVRNRWGMADNVSVTIDAMSTGGIPNPYLDFIIDSVDYGGVGTYSNDDNGMIIEQQEVIGVNNPFQIKVSSDTPNDMVFNINVTITYNNALDENDLTVYESKAMFTIKVRNGTILPALIDSDMLLTNDRYYIISKPTLIEQGVTVNVEPGTIIYFKNSVDIGSGNLIESLLNVRGTLNVIGTKDQMIKFEAGDDQLVDMKQSVDGVINLKYVEVENPQIKIETADYVRFYQNEQDVYILNQSKDGYKQVGLQVIAESIINSKFEGFVAKQSWYDAIVSANLENNIFDSSNIRIIVGFSNFALPDKYYSGYALNVSFDNPTIARNNLFLNNGGFYYNRLDYDGGYYRPMTMMVGTDTINAFYNNAIQNNYHIDSLDSVLHIYAKHSVSSSFTRYGIVDPYLSSDYSSDTIDLQSNYWGDVSNSLIDSSIHDFFENFYSEKIIYTNDNDVLNYENVFPFVTRAYLLNSQGEEVFTVNNETIRFVVEFNRDMDTSIPLDVRFGSSMPYADYHIEGDFVTPRRWEGVYTLQTTIENGYQYLSITNGASAADSWFSLGEDVGRFMFEIDTTAAQALIMQGSANEQGINLSWMQDDFDTLAGYNVYRSTSEDGYYQRLNDYIIPVETKSFFDDTVEPGVTYYYNFTVVKTDLTESIPSGKIVIQSLDTMAPNIYHTPVYEGFTNSNLMIRASITDNLMIQEAYVYYRSVGDSTWQKTQMTNLNDQYSAVISANFLLTSGFEYYIEAFDGISYTYKGSQTNPYSVVIKQAIDANAFGDVNGDETITVLDALMVLQAINDQLNLSSEEFLRADLDEDGILEAWEALRILQYVSGKVTTIK